LGDRQKAVKLEESVMHSPVVFGVKRSVATRLGWIDKEVTIAEILRAADANEFRFSMTSAAQSNSGACAYLGFLHALAGSPDVLTTEHLTDPKVQDSTRRLLRRIDRSSGSSGWLKQMIVQRYSECEAMVNYESLIIEANRELVAKGNEPLIAIYPADGLTIADSPLGYVDHGDPDKKEFFQKLIAYLKSPEVQTRIVALGRRAGLVGLDQSKVDLTVFNPDWGISIDRIIAPIQLPGEQVLREALSLYQSGGLRKPSATVYAIDCSGSMKDGGIQQLKKAMNLLLDPEQSRRYLLQPSKNDIHLVVPFDAQPREPWIARGNDPAVLSELRSKIDQLYANGGTDMYSAIERGITALDGIGPLNDYFPAVIVMTDGMSQGNVAHLQEMLKRRSGVKIPIFSITFAKVDDRQLKPLSEMNQGRVFNGTSDLTKAFRDARGYN
jgi:Ca-activated chloride channel homolog